MTCINVFVLSFSRSLKMVCRLLSEFICVSDALHARSTRLNIVMTKMGNIVLFFVNQKVAWGLLMHCTFM